MKQKSICLPDKYWEELEEHAKELGISSIAEVIRIIINDWRRGRVK